MKVEEGGWGKSFVQFFEGMGMDRFDQDTCLQDCISKLGEDKHFLTFTNMGDCFCSPLEEGVYFPRLESSQSVKNEEERKICISDPSSFLVEEKNPPLECVQASGTIESVKRSLVAQGVEEFSNENCMERCTREKGEVEKLEVVLGDGFCFCWKGEEDVLHPPTLPLFPILHWSGMDRCIEGGNLVKQRGGESV